MNDKEKARSLFEEAQKKSWETHPPNLPHRAIELAEAALAEDPDFIKAAELLANDLRRVKNYEKSIDMYKYALARAYDKEPDNHKLLRNLLREAGRVLVLAERYEEAVVYLERSLQIEYTSASEYLAEAYNKLGRYQDVINLYSHLEQTSEDGRMVDEPALHLGRAYNALGIKDKAKSVFEAGLRFNPANDAIKTEIDNLKGGLRTSEEAEWREAMGPHEFEACVKLDIKYGGTDERAKSAVNALGCVKCLQANLLEPCKNCGNQGYSFGVSPDGVIGLFCPRCKQGFTSWKCICGTVNPVSNKTLLARVKSGGGCFIATAACEAANSPEVLYLSAFRDDVLQKSMFGRMFVRWYYRLSPYLAGFISKFRILQTFARIVVIRPIIFAIRFSRNLYGV